MQNLDHLSAFDYTLPEHLIAKEPLPERDASRLLVLDRQSGHIEHRQIRDLPNLLAARDCLVFNNTRVLPARLLGHRAATGGKWEGLYLNSDADGRWKLIGQTRGYLQPNETVVIPIVDGAELSLKLIGREPDGVFVFEPSLAGSAVELLARFGTLPLPPYFDRQTPEANDWERYQTVYASQPGSVAAPTAGLHFTPSLLNACTARGIERAEVTLHVGLGTFRPVAVENLADHPMHSEWCELPAAAVEQLATTRANHGRVVAVGTTSLRTLESAMLHGGLQPWSGETRLFIRPPYQFQIVEALLTNFHLPKSTLLMLVSAFAGADSIRAAYQAAIAEQYRFFSYGDAMLIV
ncbi:MAG: tRNA preQ1(34) S-adenosylmethionine ribosyltransferase-isomerase QueA [Planctomycetales bacterium]|nr:tRNA preQ1(34) S-adenosylmethionine ribosyltransferase-isomerase QueA [Planctomycetales bacterium]